MNNDISGVAVILAVIAMLGYRFRHVIGVLFGIALSFAVPLGLLYLFVRFVKWAWTD